MKKISSVNHLWEAKSRLLPREGQPGAGVTARWHPYQQGDSPTVPEQGEQGRSAKGNQGQSQPRQGPSDERGPRSSQQVRIRTRHRHSSNMAQARTTVEGPSSNVAPRQRRDVQKKHLAALYVPSSLIPAYMDGLHQSWPPAQAAGPCLGGRGCRGWGACGALLQGFSWTCIFRLLSPPTSVIEVTKETSVFA